MGARVRKVCVNWVIPPKQAATASPENRVISISRHRLENQLTGVSKSLKDGGVQFSHDDFNLNLPDINVAEELSRNGTFFLSRFVNGSALCNVYMAKDFQTGQPMPFVTMTSKDKRYFLLISNKNKKDYEIYNDRGYYIGYVPYNVEGFKFVTLGQLAEDSQLPIYVKSGKIVFNRENESLWYDALNYYLFSDKSNEIIDYRRLYKIETEDYSFIVKYSNIFFDRQGEFLIRRSYLTEDGKLNVTRLRNLKEYEDRSDGVGGFLYVNNTFQINVLYREKKTDVRKAVGYSYVKVLV